MTLEPQQIFQLVSLLAVLALFSFSLRGHINYARWFKSWEAERKARRDAELAAEARARNPRPAPGAEATLKSVTLGLVPRAHRWADATREAARRL